MGRSLRTKVRAPLPRLRYAKQIRGGEEEDNAQVPWYGASRKGQKLLGFSLSSFGGEGWGEEAPCSKACNWWHQRAALLPQPLIVIGLIFLTPRGTQKK